MTTKQEDFPLHWDTDDGLPHVGDTRTRNVFKENEGFVQQEEGTIVGYVPQEGRRPALYQWQSSSSAASVQILTQREVQPTKRTPLPEPADYTIHIMTEISNRLEANLHEYTVNKVLPDLLLHALLEEAWASFLQKMTAGDGGGTTSSSTSLVTANSSRPSYYTSPQVAAASASAGQQPEPPRPNVDYFTVTSLHQRIKAGTQLAYNYIHHHYSDETLRRSRRTSLPPRPSPYQKGGKVALYLLERLEGKTSLDEEEDTTMEVVKEAVVMMKEEQSASESAEQKPAEEGKETAKKEEEAEHPSSKEEAEQDKKDDNKKDNAEPDKKESKEEEEAITKDSKPAAKEPVNESSANKADEDDQTDKADEDEQTDDKSNDKEEKPAENGQEDEPDKEEKQAENGQEDDEPNKKKGKKKKKEEKDEEKEEVVLINAHEEELESEEDEADQDDDFEVGTNDGTDDEDDVLENVVKETPQLDIEMEEDDNEFDDDDDDDEEEEDDDEDGDYVSNNPHLQPTPESLLDWIGRRGKSVSVFEVQEAVGICLKANLALYDLSAMDQRAIGTKGDVFVLDSTEKWKDLRKYDPPTFGRCKLRLKSDTEEEQEWFRQQEMEEMHRKEKAWASWRYKSIHVSHTVWSSWNDSVEEWIKDKKGEAPAVAAIAPDVEQAAQEDEALAQSLAAASSSSSRRSARRSNANDGGVFYGTQSSMSQKQLVETVARLARQSNFHTMLSLSAMVGDDSTNPIHRLRTALGRLVWKRNQIVEHKVTSIWSDRPLWTKLQAGPLWTPDEEGTLDESSKACADVLAQYLRRLHQTELQLRNIVLRQLTYTPLSMIATAADERVGTLESFDAADFEDPKDIEWKESGHDFIGKSVFRPSQQPASASDMECRWFKVRDYVESVAWEDEGDGANGGATPVERRMRFRAFPVTEEGIEDYGDFLVLTQAQVAAGIKAGERALEDSSNGGPSEHPFAGGVGAKVTLRSESDVKQCVVVAYDTIVVEGPSANRQHKTLILPERAAEKDAFWVTMSSDSEGNLSCRMVDAAEPVLYRIEQSDYDEDSSAFQACRRVVEFLSNHKSAGIFMEPVDPVALNIPTYFDVVKHPMDISTLSSNLEKGKYSKIPQGKSIGRSAVSRMLNGPFKDEALLIFENALAFNPPDDWIHITAKALRKALLKKIEQASNQADVGGNSSGSSRGRRTPGSVYVDEDSDVDMYEYESDRDDEDFSAGRARKRKRKGGSKTDDGSLQATEAPVRLQKTLSETLGLRGPFAGLPIVSDARGFSLQSQWGCRKQERVKQDAKQKEQDDQVQKEIEEILSLQRAAEDSERASLRRSTRAPLPEPRNSRGSGSNSLKVPVEYSLVRDLPELPSILSPPSMLATNRAEVESLLEQAHESYYAKLYQQLSKDLSSDSMDGSFANAAFPPYLGRVLPLDIDGEDATWEIRSEYVVPAVRWVIRGLINSDHLSALEPLSLDAPFTSGIVMTSNIYYHDPANTPFDLLEVRRKKKEENDSSSEDEIELSEYEKLRAERVARNAERLRMLGLA